MDLANLKVEHESPVRVLSTSSRQSSPVGSLQSSIVVDADTARLNQSSIPDNFDNKTNLQPKIGLMPKIEEGTSGQHLHLGGINDDLDQRIKEREDQLLFLQATLAVRKSEVVEWELSLVKREKALEGDYAYEQARLAEKERILTDREKAMEWIVKEKFEHALITSDTPLMPDVTLDVRYSAQSSKDPSSAQCVDSNGFSMQNVMTQMQELELENESLKLRFREIDLKFNEEHIELMNMNDKLLQNINELQISLKSKDEQLLALECTIFNMNNQQWHSDFEASEIDEAKHFANIDLVLPNAQTATENIIVPEATSSTNSPSNSLRDGDLSDVNIDSIYAENLQVTSPVTVPSLFRRGKKSSYSARERIHANRYLKQSADQPKHKEPSAQDNDIESTCFLKILTPVANKSNWFDCNDNLTSNSLERTSEVVSGEATSELKPNLDVHICKPTKDSKWGMIVQYVNKEAKISNICERSISSTALQIGDVIDAIDGVRPCDRFIDCKQMNTYMKEAMELNLSIRRCTSQKVTSLSQYVLSPSMKVSLVPENFDRLDTAPSIRGISHLCRSRSSSDMLSQTSEVFSSSSLMTPFTPLPTGNSVDFENAKIFASGVAKFLVEEGLVADELTEHSISAAELVDLVKREAEITKREKDLLKSIYCIFVALLVSACIHFYL